MDNTTKYWITPANQSVYKVEEAFASLPEIDWALSSSPKVGDIVYIYLSDRQKYIRFKTEVVKTKIPYAEAILDEQFYAEGHESNEGKMFTRLRLLNRITENAVTRDLLLASGVNGNIQGTRSLTAEVAAIIDEHIEFDATAPGVQKIVLSQASKGVYTCEVPITKDQWLRILKDKSLMDAVRLRILLSFYYMPGHKATCYQCSQKYGHTANSYNAGITNFGRAVIKHLGTFNIVRADDGAQCFWPVAIGIGRTTKVDGSFEWQLRKELVEALEVLIIENALEIYLRDFDLHWDTKEWSEIYKWRAVKWFKDNWDIDAPDFAAMLDKSLAKTGNLLQSQSSFPRGMIVNMAKVAPDVIREMFANLFDESLDLTERVNNFIFQSEEIRVKYDDGTWNKHYQTTNSISVYLWLRFPDKYYIYKYSVYKEVDEKFGLGVGIKKGSVPEMIRGYKMYDRIHEVLLNDNRVREVIAAHVDGNDDLYADAKLYTATMDFGYWVSKGYQSPENSLKLKNPVNMTPFIKETSELLKNKKNIILQGAPGTGKTYNTAAIALALIDGTVPESHSEVMERYEQLRNERRIGFTTFHQSMDYEDFIEGIKPLHENGGISYQIEDGIFKQLCEKAQENFEDSTKTIQELTRETTLKEKYDELVEKIQNDEIEKLPIISNGKFMLIDGVSENGNIILKTANSSKDVPYAVSYNRLKRLAEAYPTPTAFFAMHNVSQTIINTIGGCHPSSFWAVLNYLYTSTTAKKSETVVTEVEEKPYVLIIDEINRGNVSKIFGELITLIERDKRIGAEHPVTLSLPYSKTDNFGVPQNLYIIGTMNTTDRSTGTIDYAIRRRFAFKTLEANRELVEGDTAKALFDDVKSFIERFKYADMDLVDVMVGHSYFMADDNEELAMKIKYEVIPLVKEYIKDGILSIKPDDAKRYFDAWLNLETLDADDNDDGTAED